MELEVDLSMEKKRASTVMEKKRAIGPIRIANIMSSRTGDKGVDVWLQIKATESDDEPQQQQTAIVYRRKKPQKESAPTTKQLSCSQKNRVSLVPEKRISWNRSLFTRGRTSIAVTNCAQYGPEKEKRLKKHKPPLARAKGVPLQNYDRECAYFQEVDAFELLEESPSPQKKTWLMGTKNGVAASDISSVLKKWLLTRKLIRNSCEPSASLSRILETPGDSIRDDVLEFPSLKTCFKTTSGATAGVKSNHSKYNSRLIGDDVLERHTSSIKRIEEIQTMSEEDSVIEVAIRNLSLSSQDSLLDEQRWDPLLALLAVCGQSSPSTFSDVLSDYCDLQSITKVGEGTYGEVFIAGEAVCKVVPFNGDLLVNGEIQKKAEELLEEVMLSLTLNQLRGRDDHIHNICPTFIETLRLRVCTGAYDDAMIRAWEQWDKKHFSENDHPREFTEKQCFVVFVQEHGGQDLESFVLLGFNEVRSLLVQVTVALAVAEAAFEFEHRDLHWGNILLSRKGCETLQFILDGKKMHVKTYGVDRTSRDERELRSLKKRLNGYGSAKEAVNDPFFTDLLLVCE
ncbi:Protein kinase, catalytic domain-containing protein [Cynara cardunculus var. scolymus]|uniref:Protein kinase, catalytic domain-containing protein n=1 Tax=Cynara cardunculus var. scolymus TaxID=59895 RepID=A0A103XK78_CYNCS|nr:Protein kinase, catalytic domain-containing protein [Cynara cardunculus var. scolymus]